ncbi:hypothetical protein CC86DRAFT_404862 [Ophiobolus disseminans]|uniref:Uncharacterized protein n=1 Tax=Ophiobolus disseminans TaxID=1469910 RepID=A0A6A7A3C5_9PLEO|nr:hypothetical protein CC86DRAFT_404862 [Ophiobolus disseminans]
MVDLTEDEPITPASARPTPSVISEPVSSTPIAPFRPKPSKPLSRALSKIQAAQFDAFRPRQYYILVTGSYTVICPHIAERIPAIADQLRLEIGFLSVGTMENRVLEAYLDLGLLTGSMVLGSSKEHLAKRCCLQHELSGHQFQPQNDQDNAIQRVGADYLVAWESLGNATSDDGGQHFQPVKTNSTIPPTSTCEYRLRDDHRLFIKPDHVFADRGLIEFSDMTELEFSGKLSLPMLIDEPIAITGFKLDASTALKGMHKWGQYDTSKVRYGHERRKQTTSKAQSKKMTLHLKAQLIYSELLSSTPV